MIDRTTIQGALNTAIATTQFDFLGTKYEGKVRDCYDRGRERVIVTTDRLTAFDKFITTIPFKGAVLQHLAMWGFQGIEHIVPHHVIAAVDPNIIVARKCEVVPIEVVVRGYLAGSAWRNYVKGKPVSGVMIEPGLKEFAPLSQPILTPSTKAPVGQHDEPIATEEILSRGIVTPRLWEEITAVALALFAHGSAKARERGLILVDTKYEFGLYDGSLMVIDEIHTLDCSRYWLAASYTDRLQRGEPPEMLDKENVRRWLMAHGYMGEGEVPRVDPEVRIDIAQLYLDACAALTGELLPSTVFEDPQPRLLKAAQLLSSQGLA